MPTQFGFSFLDVTNREQPKHLTKVMASLTCKRFWLPDRLLDRKRQDLSQFLGNLSDWMSCRFLKFGQSLSILRQSQFVCLSEDALRTCHCYFGHMWMTCRAHTLLSLGNLLACLSHHIGIALSTRAARACTSKRAETFGTSSFSLIMIQDTFHSEQNGSVYLACDIAQTLQE